MSGVLHVKRSVPSAVRMLMLRRSSSKTLIDLPLAEFAGSRGLRNGAPESAPRRRTSAARDPQGHAGAGLQAYFQTRSTTRSKIAQIDERYRHFSRRFRRCRHPTTFGRILQRRSPAAEQTWVDPLTLAELRHRQSAARLLKNNCRHIAALRLIRMLYPICPFQLLKNRRTLSKSSQDRKERRVLTWLPLTQFALSALD